MPILFPVAVFTTNADAESGIMLADRITSGCLIEPSSCVCVSHSYILTTATALFYTAEAIDYGLDEAATGVHVLVGILSLGVGSALTLIGGKVFWVRTPHFHDACSDDMSYKPCSGASLGLSARRSSES